MTATELERLKVVFLGDATHYEKTLKDIVLKTEKATKELVGNATSMIDQASKNLAVASGVFSAAFGAAAAYSVSSFSGFNSAMTESTAIVRLTAQEMKIMEQQALDLGTKGKQGPTELAQSYFYLFSAGMSAKQAIAALPAVQSFATAGAFSLSEATTLASDSQKALGLDVTDAAKNMQSMTRVMDVLVKANTLANANVRQFAIALTSDAAAALRNVNKDVEEGVAVLATYADRGIKAEEAGGMLGRSMRLLTQAAERSASAHKSLGFSVYDSSGKMRNLADIVANLEQIMGNMSDEAKGATLSMLGFKALTQKAIMPLIGASEKIREYERQLRAAGGTTEEVAEKQMKSFANQTKVLQNTIAAASIEIGQVLAPTLRSLNTTATQTVSLFRSVSPEFRTVAVASAAVGASVAPVILAATGLRIAWASVSITLGGIGQALATYVTATSAATVATNAFRLAMITGGVYIGGQFLFGVLGGASALKTFNAELAQSTDLAGKLASMTANRTSKALSEALAVADPRKRFDALKAELDRAEKEVLGTESALKSARDRAVEAAHLGNVAMSYVPIVGTGFDAEIKAANASVTDAKARYDAAKEAVGKFAAELDKLKKSGVGPKMFADPKLKAEVDQLTERLTKQVQTFGMSARAAQLFKLSLQDATKEQLANARGLADMLAQADKMKTLSDSIKEFGRSLRSQIDTFGMTSDAARLFELSQQGATDSQIDSLKALLEQKKALEDHKKLLDEGKKITEQYATPQEKLGKQMETLDALLANGAISFETYARAAKDAGKQVAGITSELQRLDATQSGSAESVARMRAYLERIGNFTPQVKQAQQVALQPDIKLPQKFIADTAIPDEVAQVHQQAAGFAFSDIFATAAGQFFAALPQVQAAAANVPQDNLDLVREDLTLFEQAFNAIAPVIAAATAGPQPGDSLGGTLGTLIGQAINNQPDLVAEQQEFVPEVKPRPDQPPPLNPEEKDWHGNVIELLKKIANGNGLGDVGIF